MCGCICLAPVCSALLYSLTFYPLHAHTHELKLTKKCGPLTLQSLAIASRLITDTHRGPEQKQDKKTRSDPKLQHVHEVYKERKQTLRCEERRESGIGVQALTSSGAVSLACRVFVIGCAKAFSMLADQLPPPPCART